VRVDASDLNNITAIAAGAISSYALSADGSLWVWGGNSYGELGVGTMTSQFLTPQHLLAPSGYAFSSISAQGNNAMATLKAVPEPTLFGLLVSITLLCRRRITTTDKERPEQTRNSRSRFICS
jgi:hypothetical protein